MKETFKISVVNTRTQSRTDLESNAVTLGDLKSELNEMGIDYSGMTFMEGSTKVELKDDSSILPTNVPVKRNGVATGETTNNLVFFLTTPNKNIKSGAMSRADAYAEIKRLGLQTVCIEKFGRNFTQCPTDGLIQIVVEATTPKKVTKKTTKVVEEVVETPATPCNCQAIVDATLAYAKALTEAGYLTEEHYKGFEAIANGESAPKVTYSGYTNSDIDNMYGDWMK
jgi:hypothetical protein